MATKISKNESSAGISKKIAAARTYISNRITDARIYFDESKAEIKKVTWPTRGEVRVTTLAVLILVAVMSIFLGVIDFGLVTAVKKIATLGM